MNTVSLTNKNTYAPSFSGFNIKHTAKILDVSKEFIPKKDIGKIYGQACAWMLHEEKTFEEFIRADEELQQLISDEIVVARDYGFFPSVDVLLNLKDSRSNVSDFFKKVQEKYKIDLSQPPKVYRFIGQSEVDVLKRGEPVYPQRPNGKLDVTINPVFNWNKYRVTFKPRKELSILDKENEMTGVMRHNPSSGHEYCYHYDSSYSMNDVEKIEEIEIK